MHSVGERIEIEEPPPLTGILETHQNYFVVFDNSSRLLGLLDTETATRVIKTYVNAKAFLDELINYKKLTDRHFEAQIRNKSNPTEETLDEQNTTFERIHSFFPYLKERHFQVKKLVEETISMFDKVN